jgi:hypothetical protein
MRSSGVAAACSRSCTHQKLRANTARDTICLRGCRGAAARPGLPQAPGGGHPGHPCIPAQAAGGGPAPAGTFSAAAPPGRQQLQRRRRPRPRTRRCALARARRTGGARCRAPCGSRPASASRPPSHRWSPAGGGGWAAGRLAARLVGRGERPGLRACAGCSQAAATQPGSQPGGRAARRARTLPLVPATWMTLSCFSSSSRPSLCAAGGGRSPLSVACPVGLGSTAIASHPGRAPSRPAPSPRPPRGRTCTNVLACSNALAQPPASALFLKRMVSLRMSST